MIKLEYKGQAVLTTDQLATIFGTTPANLKMNFSNNKEYFEEGEDFFKLEGVELATLKAELNRVTESYSVQGNRVNEIYSVVQLLETPDDPTLDIPMPMIGKNARSLMLWTLMGMTSHAKLLTTPAAWAVHKRMRRVYFAAINGKQLEAPKTLTLNGASVWTIRQASRIFNVSKGKIQAALQTRTFSRGKDFVVTNIEQLRQLRTENGMWFRNALTLIYERGMMKLRARFGELPSLFEPTKQIPSELKSFGQLLKDRASAMIDGGMLLKELGTRLTTE